MSIPFKNLPNPPFGGWRKFSDPSITFPLLHTPEAYRSGIKTDDGSMMTFQSKTANPYPQITEPKNK